MRILMVGAGCAGAMMTRFLEATKTNEVTYYVRSGGKRALPRIKLIDAKSGEISVREKPACIEPEGTLGQMELVVLAVRPDQLDDALAVAERVPGNPAIAVVSTGPDALQRLRSRFATRQSVQIVPLFVAWRDADAIRWWHPPLLPSLIAGDLTLATELQSMFKTGGLPTRVFEAPARALDLYHSGTASLSRKGVRGLLGSALGAARLVPREVLEELRRRA